MTTSSAVRTRGLLAAPRPLAAEATRRWLAWKLPRGREIACSRARIRCARAGFQPGGVPASEAMRVPRTSR